MKFYTAIYKDEAGFRTAIPLYGDNIKEALNMLEEFGYDIDKVEKIFEKEEDDE